MKAKRKIDVGPVEKNVPIPLGGEAAEPGLTVRVRALETGESFTVPKADKGVLTTAARRAVDRSRGYDWVDGHPREKIPKAFEIREVEEGRVRIWRTM
jgi:hypothetical protein